MSGPRRTTQEDTAFRDMTRIADAVETIRDTLTEPAVRLLRRPDAEAILDEHGALEGRGGGVECWCGWPDRAWFEQHPDVHPDFLQHHVLDLLFPGDNR